MRNRAELGVLGRASTPSVDDCCAPCKSMVIVATVVSVPWISSSTTNHKKYEYVVTIRMTVAMIYFTSPSLRKLLLSADMNNTASNFSESSTQHYRGAVGSEVNVKDFGPKAPCLSPVEIAR